MGLTLQQNSSCRASYACRLARGTEAPEAAKAFLDNNKYVPSSAHDMWAFGLLLLELLGGCKDPEQLLLILTNGDTLKYAADLLSAPPGKTYQDKVHRWSVPCHVLQACIQSVEPSHSHM